MSLHFGEHQLGALSVEHGDKILEHVTCGRVNIRNWLCFDDDPKWPWLGAGEFADLVAESTRIGEDQRCIKPIHHASGKLFRIWVAPDVVEAAQPRDSTQGLSLIHISEPTRPY